MSNKLDDKTIAQMHRDAIHVQKLLDSGVENFTGAASELVGDLCCHVLALSAMVEELQADLHQARSGDPTLDLINTNRDTILQMHEEAVRRVRRCIQNARKNTETTGFDWLELSEKILDALSLFHPMHGESWAGWPEGST